MPCIESKLHFTCGDHPDGTFLTKSGHLGPSDDLFKGQKAKYRTYWGLKRAVFADILAFWEPLGGLQRSGNGSVMPTLLTWASGTIIWCLEPNLVPYKTSRGKKRCHLGVKQTPLNPPRPRKTPPTPPKTPLNPIIDPPYNQLNPSSYLITQ